KELQAAVKLQPSLTEAQTRLGLLLQRAGDAQAAVGVFRTVVALQPNELCPSGLPGASLTTCSKTARARTRSPRFTAAKPWR
ncbi:MAG TPA: hypothetical protein VK579_11510, partial [Terriglobales bacterium]|nr:hypothetical protein [Terriglobales bacterium]